MGGLGGSLCPLPSQPRIGQVDRMPSRDGNVKANEDEDLHASMLALVHALEEEENRILFAEFGNAAVPQDDGAIAVTKISRPHSFRFIFRQQPRSSRQFSRYFRPFSDSFAPRIIGAIGHRGHPG